MGERCIRNTSDDPWLPVTLCRRAIRVNLHCRLISSSGKPIGLHWSRREAWSSPRPAPRRLKGRRA